MNKKLICTGAITWIAGALATCLYFNTKMPFGSVDAALHYLVVDHYHEWSPVYDPIMVHYPPLGHSFAALLAFATDISPFMATHYSSLIFLFVTYAVLFYTLNLSGLNFGTIASIGLMLTVYGLRYSWSIYGFEIIGNFFFAQIAGEAAFLLSMLILGMRARSLHEMWLLPLIAFVFGWIYPVAQIKFAAGALLLWGVEILRIWLTSGFLQRRNIFCLILLSAGLSISILVHPAFHFMVGIADHPGGINPAVGSLYVLRSYNLALFAVGAFWIIYTIKRPDEDFRRGTVLPVIAVAISVVAGLQDLAHFLGFGSEYAVRKYTYAIVTVLTAILMQTLVILLRTHIIRYQGQKHPYFQVVMAAFFAASTIVVLVSTYAFDRGDFVAIQDEVREYPSLRGITIAQMEDQQQEFDYILSLVDFRAPRPLAVDLNLGVDAGYAGPAPRFKLVSRDSAVPVHCDAEEFPLQLARLVRFDCR